MQLRALVGFVVLGITVAPPPSEACATASPAMAEVRVVDEEAVIVWDAATRTEHFIRRAKFASSTHAFGFLVPTPTTPKLGEMPAYVFGELADAIRPAVEIDDSGHTFELGTLMFEMCAMRSKSMAVDRAAVGGVRVLQAVNVAGFDATTVEADDPAALAAWLAARGFARTPALDAWLARYVTDRWKLTAFVVATEETEEKAYEVATRAVTMSFTTERPFYPYREPQMVSPPPASPRSLRVYVLASDRFAAT